MLVLSRREGEKIRIGDSIVITVVRTIGDKVRIGIEAPSDVVVLRDELEPRGKESGEKKREETAPLPSGLIHSSLEGSLSVTSPIVSTIR